jgi:hypothetical protein
MKKLHIIALSALLVFVTSCFKDNNKYDYAPLEKITVTGINSTYDVISMVDTLKITPTVTSTDPAARLDYFWGLFDPNVTGVIPKMDTISKSLALKYFITKPSKVWSLIFGAKNKNTGYTSITSISLNVITQFTRGWYVFKDDGSKSDLDLFLTPSTIVPTSKMENIFSLVNGKKLDGKAKFFSFDAQYRTNVLGSTYVATRVLFLNTDKDASVINTSTVQEFYDFNGCFYEVPSVKAPGAIFLGSSADYFVNDGKLYSIANSVANFGKFSGPQMKDANNTPYRLSDYFYTYYTVANPIFFDETSSSFISAGSTGNTLTAVTDATGTAMKANNNNKTLLFMGLKAISPLTAIAVLKDKTNQNLKILSTITPTYNAFKMVNDTLLTTSKAYNATLYTCNISDENLLYFVVGNQIWSRNLTNKAEQLQYTVPAGETVTFIRHKKYSTETAYTFNYVIIGTKSGTNYTVRMFTKTAGNLAATPSVTLTGNGSVCDVFYLSPSVTYYANPVSY